MDFETWFAELKEVAIKKYGFKETTLPSFDAEAFKSYFEDGYSPEGAMDEDMAYA